MPLGTSLGVIRNKKAKISYEYDILIKKIVYTPANLFFLFDNGKLLGIGCNDTLQLDAQGILETNDPTQGPKYYINYAKTFRGNTKSRLDHFTYGGKPIIINMPSNFASVLYVNIENLIDFDSIITNIYTPFYATCIGIKSDGTLWGWGYNQYNTLGLPFGINHYINSWSADKPTSVQDNGRDITFKNIGKYIINVPTKIGNSNNWKSIVTNPIKTLYRYIDDLQNEYRHILLNTNGEIFKLGGSIGNPEKIGSNNNWKYISYNYAINNNNKLFKLSYVDESEIKKSSVLGCAVLMPTTQDDLPQYTSDYPIIEPVYEYRAAFNAKNMNTFREILTDVKQFQADSRTILGVTTNLRDETYYFLGNNGILSSYGGKAGAPYQRTNNVGKVSGKIYQTVYDAMVNQLSASDSIVRTHKSFYVMDRSGFAITTDNKLTVWGNNIYGRLGINTTNNFIRNMETLNINVSKVIPNPYNTFIISPNNNLSACGANDSSGMLGDNTSTESKTFKQILTNVTDVVTNLYSNYAIGTNGKLSGWGLNNIGQLGIPEGEYTLGGIASNPVLGYEYEYFHAMNNGDIYFIDHSNYFRKYTKETNKFEDIYNLNSTVSIVSGMIFYINKNSSFFITEEVNPIIYFLTSPAPNNFSNTNIMLDLYKTPLSSPDFANATLVRKEVTQQVVRNSNIATYALVYDSKFVIDTDNNKGYFVTRTGLNIIDLTKPSTDVSNDISVLNTNSIFTISTTLQGFTPTTTTPSYAIVGVDLNYNPITDDKTKYSVLLAAGREGSGLVTRMILNRSDNTKVSNNTPFIASNGYSSFTTGSGDNYYFTTGGDTSYVNNIATRWSGTPGSGMWPIRIFSSQDKSKTYRVNYRDVINSAITRRIRLAQFPTGTFNLYQEPIPKRFSILSYKNILSPKELANVKDVKKVVTAGLANNNTFAILTSGEVYAWGTNQDNQLGINGTSVVDTPTLLPLSGIEDIVISGDYNSLHYSRTAGGRIALSGSAMTTYFIDKNGGLSSCGSNAFGALGIGLNRTIINTNGQQVINVPFNTNMSLSSNGITKINIPPIKSLKAAYFGAFAVGKDNGLSAWGYPVLARDITNTPTSSAQKVSLPPIKEFIYENTNTNILENIFSEWGKGLLILPQQYFGIGSYYVLGINNHLSGGGDNVIWVRPDTDSKFYYYGRLGDNNSNFRLTNSVNQWITVSTDFTTISSIHNSFNGFFILGDIKNKKRIYDPIQIGSDDWKVVDKHSDLAIKMDGTLWCLSAETPYQMGTDSNYTNITYGTPIKSTDKYDTAIVSNYVVSDVDYNILNAYIDPKPSTQVEIYNYRIPTLSGGTNVTGVSGNHNMLTQELGFTTALAKAEYRRINKMDKPKTIVKY
jgi:alpha-tubulin suppressor-like RCC1 family protein